MRYTHQEASKCGELRFAARREPRARAVASLPLDCLHLKGTRQLSTSRNVATSTAAADPALIANINDDFVATSGRFSRRL